MENKSQERLENELHVCEAIMPMTLAERKLLKKWVEAGHSPFSNPYGFISMNGGQMFSFISSLAEMRRFQELGVEGYKSFSRYSVKFDELVVPGWENANEGLMRAKP